MPGGTVQVRFSLSLSCFSHVPALIARARSRARIANSTPPEQSLAKAAKGQSSQRRNPSMSLLFERKNQFALIRDLVHNGPVEDGQLPLAKKSEWARIGHISYSADGQGDGANSVGVIFRNEADLCILVHGDRRGRGWTRVNTDNKEKINIGSVGNSDVWRAGALCRIMQVRRFWALCFATHSQFCESKSICAFLCRFVHGFWFGMRNEPIRVGRRMSDLTAALPRV
jgi:hypothetical protein